jgi:hypothetical protein
MGSLSGLKTHVVEPVTIALLACPQKDLIFILPLWGYFLMKTFTQNGGDVFLF